MCFVRQVNFSEPLSMLQRLTEDFEYSYLLDRAAECDDPCEQMCYVAAFTVSAYATTSQRSGKPFNPLLGETYECDRRDDYGWRAVSEQVSTALVGGGVGDGDPRLDGLREERPTLSHCLRLSLL